MKTIQEDIKAGQFKHVYLLYGEEDYLRRQYAKRLMDALSDEEDTANTTRFSGRDIDPGEVIDLAETMPFFAEHRCIFIEDCGFFKKGGEALADYVESVPGSTYLIFSESEVDRRSRLFKQVNKAGYAAEFPRQSEEDLMRWVLGRLKREHKKITRPVMELFLFRTGDQMELIDRELEKLLSYTMGREVIGAEEVAAVCGAQVAGRIFEMVDAVALKQQARALELYYDLLLQKEPPMRILFLITRQFQILMQLKEMEERGFDPRTMASQVKVPGFAIRKYLDQASRFTDRQLLAAVRDGVQAEEDIKTGQMEDRLAVELLLVTYSK